MRKILAVALVLVFIGNADARGRLFGRRACCDCAPCPGAEAEPLTGTATTSLTVTDADAHEALAEVNAARAARGMRPYQYDTGLTEAALRAAKFRATRLMAGHTRNDFAFVPTGYQASAAGCAAWPRGMGFGSCCMFEGWRRAGAAFCVGRDGRRYMHLFVGN